MSTLRGALTWLVRGLLFIFLLVFAMKNTDLVTMNFLFGHAWQAPLALMLFLTLMCGAALGLLAGLERIFAQRREIQALERQLTLRHEDNRAAPLAASAADLGPQALSD